MKKNGPQIHVDSLDGLLSAIDLYFDCRLSDEEELIVRRAISTTMIKHPAIDEAKAVMGLRNPVKRVPDVVRIVGIAASVALLLVGAVGLLYASAYDDNEYCYAYVNGKKITDEDEVMKLFIDDFEVMCGGVQDADSRLDKMLDFVEPAIEEYNSVNPLNI